MNRRKQSPPATADWERGPRQAGVDGDARRGRGFLVASGPHPSSHEGPVQGQRTPLLALVYFLLAGIVSLTIGAAVSLTTSGTGRLVLWSGVTGILAVVAGFAYDSRLVRDRFPAFRNRGNQFGRP
jgi:hypothetical protein